jgi:glycosyltransferase involved in cell wall biosynthesis
VCDFLEEQWPSMDLIGDMLLRHLSGDLQNGVRVGRIRPSMRRRFTAAGGAATGLGFKADRLFNRYWYYPRQLRRHAESFDVFHLVDHSYAHLVLELPADRTLVTCHDLDTFRCLLQPEIEKRSAPFRAMVRRTLRGLQRAARVVCPSAATRDALVACNLVPVERLRIVPLAAQPSCSSEADAFADGEIARTLGPVRASSPEVLHVGSTIPRKRVDVLLEVFSEVRRVFPGARLVRVGGAFTPEQESMLERLRLEDAVVVQPYLDGPLLAAAYRRAAVVLLVSEREGFGLPLVEAMACGTPVAASDLPALHEVGGDACVYCPVGDVAAWAAVVTTLLRERLDDPAGWAIRSKNAIARAGRFTWQEYARRMVEVYKEVFAGRAAS